MKESELTVDVSEAIGYDLSNDEIGQNVSSQNERTHTNVYSYLCFAQFIVGAYSSVSAFFFDDMPIDIKRIRVATEHKTGKGESLSTLAGEDQEADRLAPIRLNAMRTRESGTWPSSVNDIRLARYGSLEREEDVIDLDGEAKGAGSSMAVWLPEFHSWFLGGLLSLRFAQMLGSKWRHSYA